MSYFTCSRRFSVTDEDRFQKILDKLGTESSVNRLYDTIVTAEGVRYHQLSANEKLIFDDTANEPPEENLKAFANAVKPILDGSLIIQQISYDPHNICETYCENVLVQTKNSQTLKNVAHNPYLLDYLYVATDSNIPGMPAYSGKLDLFHEVDLVIPKKDMNSILSRLELCMRNAAVNFLKSAAVQSYFNGENDLLHCHWDAVQIDKSFDFGEFLEEIESFSKNYRLITIGVNTNNVKIRYGENTDRRLLTISRVTVEPSDDRYIAAVLSENGVFI